MNAFVVWLESTTLSRGIVHYPWIWPLCEIIHFIGLTWSSDRRFFTAADGVMKPSVSRHGTMPLAIAGSYD